MSISGLDKFFDYQKFGTLTKEVNTKHSIIFRIVLHNDVLIDFLLFIV